MININEYDQIIFGISGGKDSTALMLWGIYESGWPINKMRFVFCDTGNEDALTYAYIKLLSDNVHPIETVDPGMSFYELSHKRNRFPATKTRFCTDELKIKPKHKMFASLIDSGINPLNATGIRNDEGHSSNNRDSVLYLEYEQFYYREKYYNLANVNPLIKWSLDDVWNIHRKYIDIEDAITIVDEDPDLDLGHKSKLIELMMRDSIPCNPLYYMGARRVGCFPCINSRKAEIRAMAKYRPERIDFLREQENDPAFTKGISTFFARNTVPKSFRSKKIITTSGEEMYVRTIDDVVLWSQTKYGGKQFSMEFADHKEPLTVCRIGQHCE